MGTYKCRMKGCVGSGSFTMEPKEEEWHLNKFSHLPTNCPACRAFKKSQENVDVTCSACEFTFTVTAQQIIGWHIHNGIWEKPKHCKMCEEDPNREVRKRLQKEARAVANKFYNGQSDHPRQHLLRPVKKGWFQKNAQRKVAHAREYLMRWVNASQDGSYEDLRKLSEQWTVTTVEVSTDPEIYRQKFQKQDGNVYEHLHRHFRGNETENLSRIGVKSEGQVLDKLNELANITDPNQVVEFRDAGSGFLVKYHFDTGSTIVIHDQIRTQRDDDGKVVTIDEPPPPPPYIRTSFPKNLSQVGRKMQNLDGQGWVPNLLK